MMSFDDQLIVALSCSHADRDRNVLNLSQACNNFCCQCCATLMPFFGVTNIEFMLLIDRTSLYDDDEYFSISRLNKLSSNNNKNNLFTTFTAFLFIQYFNALLAVFSKSSGLL